MLEESRTGKGANARMRDKYFPVILNNSQYAKRLPIGKDDVLKNFKYETLNQFHKDFYRPDLEGVAVVHTIGWNGREKRPICWPILSPSYKKHNK